MPAKRKTKPSTKKSSSPGKKRKPAAKCEPSMPIEPSEPEPPKFATLDGEAYDLLKPGEPRRRHGSHGAAQPQLLNIDQKYSIIDSILSKLTAGVSCDELYKLAQHVTRWAAELQAVHEFDVSDEQIHQGRLVFPTDWIHKLIAGLMEFQERTSTTTEDVVDLILARLKHKPDPLALTN